MDSPLLAEQRRHWRTSFGLVVAALAAGVAVSNERGVFMPIWGVDDAVAATARAFAAVAPPQPLQIDSLYSPATTLPHIAAVPRFRRIVDVPGYTPPVMPAFATINSFAETPAGVGQIAVTAPDLSAAGTPTSFAALTTPQPQFAPAAVQVAAVPEPVSWGLMVAGFGLVGALQRRVARLHRHRRRLA